MGVDIHKVIGKIPFKQKSGFVLPYNPLHLQLDSKDRPHPGEEPYNAVDAISMRQDICYRDNKTGKPEYDRKMLDDLNALVPRGIREKVDRQLVRGIIGMKHRLGVGIWSSQLADELHKPVRKRFKNTACLLSKSTTADLVDMSPYLLTVINVFSKYGWVVPLKTKTVKVALALQKLFTTTNARPSRLWTDKGTEFYNQQLNRVLTAINVTLYSKENVEKSSVVGRWNRTMKNMWKYSTANNTEIY